MQPFKLPNAAASVITATSTAQKIEALIETAAGEKVELAEQDAIDLIARTEGFTYLDNGNVPTAVNGFQVEEGGVISLRGLSLNRLYLIRTGSIDATVEVRVGQTNYK